MPEAYVGLYLGATPQLGSPAPPVAPLARLRLYAGGGLFRVQHGAGTAGSRWSGDRRADVAERGRTLGPAGRTGTAAASPDDRNGSIRRHAQPPTPNRRDQLAPTDPFCSQPQKRHPCRGSPCGCPPAGCLGNKAGIHEGHPYGQSVRSSNSRGRADPTSRRTAGARRLSFRQSGGS